MEEEYKTQMIVLDKGLNLYHSGFINNPETLKQLKKEGMWDKATAQYIKRKIPKGGVDLSVPDHAKFFSLDKHHPYYYGVDDITRGASQFITTRPIILIDIEKKDLSEKSRKLLKELSKIWRMLGEKTPKEEIPDFLKCFDGWIGYDDFPVSWREVFLFRPWEVISKGKRYYLDPEEAEKTRKERHYQYQEEELDSLHKHLIGCYDVSYKDNTIGLLSKLKTCDTLSLKYV